MAMDSSNKYSLPGDSTYADPTPVPPPSPFTPTPNPAQLTKPPPILGMCFIHPSYHRHGVDSILVFNAITKADGIGWESYVDTTQMGKSFYEASGMWRGSGGSMMLGRRGGEGKRGEEGGGWGWSEE